MAGAEIRHVRPHKLGHEVVVDHLAQIELELDLCSQLRPCAICACAAARAREAATNLADEAVRADDRRGATSRSLRHRQPATETTGMTTA